VIGATCVACHGATPIQGVPSSMTTYAQLTAPSTTQPGKSVAAVALARMQDTAMPMPPAPLPRAAAAQVAAFQAWVDAGTPRASCPDGGAPADGGGIVDPFAAAPVCTSKKTWTGGNKESPDMNPGMACIDCHTSMKEGPTLTIGGTLYPTAHEPDLCNGGVVTAGARVVITGANGKVVTLTPNAAGNFQFEGAVAKPYKASVTYMGRERVMLEAQTSGDCNACHTQAGTMKAPGRILLP
jgi:cytochrome c553